MIHVLNTQQSCTLVNILHVEDSAKLEMGKEDSLSMENYCLLTYQCMEKNLFYILSNFI